MHPQHIHFPYNVSTITSRPCSQIHKLSTTCTPRLFTMRTWTWQDIRHVAWPSVTHDPQRLQSLKARKLPSHPFHIGCTSAIKTGFLTSAGMEIPSWQGSNIDFYHTRWLIPLFLRYTWMFYCGAEPEKSQGTDVFLHKKVREKQREKGHQRIW